MAQFRPEQMAACPKRSTGASRVVARAPGGKHGMLGSLASTSAKGSIRACMHCAALPVNGQRLASSLAAPPLEQLSETNANVWHKLTAVFVNNLFDNKPCVSPRLLARQTRHPSRRDSCEPLALSRSLPLPLVGISLQGSTHYHRNRPDTEIFILILY
jgi:hypothetical protein